MRYGRLPQSKIKNYKLAGINLEKYKNNIKNKKNKMAKILRFKKNPSYKKRKYKKRKISPSKAAYKALSLVKEMKRNEELKVYEDDTSAAISTSPVIDYAVSYGITQGTAYTERIGNKITVKKILFKAKMTHNGSASSNFVRVMIGLDRDCLGVAIGASEILNADITAAPYILQFREIRSTWSCTILMDKIMKTDSGNENDWLEWYFDCNIDMGYDASTGAITDLNGQALFLFLVSDQTTNTPTVSTNLRLRYVDP